MDPNTPGADAPLHPAQSEPTTAGSPDPRNDLERAADRERAAAAGVTAGEPTAIAAAQNDEIVSDEDEWGALDFLLGATQALRFSLPVQYDTPRGRQEITLEIQQLDPTKMEQIDNENRQGDSALGRLNRAGFNAGLCAAGVLSITDKTGRTVSTHSAEWFGGIPSPEAAMAARFRFQGGILDMVADQIQAISGYSADRVGTAQRRLVEAGKG